MSKIMKLTPEQEAELPVFRQKYLDIACGGGRADRAKLQAALTDAYAVIGKPAPRLFIFDSPAACMLAIKVFEMGSRGDLKLGDQLGGQLRGQLGDQLWDQLGGQLRGQLGDQLWDQLRGQLWGQLWDQLGGQLRGQLGDQLWDQLGGQLRGQLGDQLWDQLRDQLWGQLRGQLWDQLGGQLGDQLRDQLWDQLGDQLGDQLRGQLWGQLRGQLWDQLGDQKIWNPNFLWGSHDLYWITWYRFGQKIGVKYTADSANKLDIIEAVSSQCEWWWPFENMVIACERPTTVRWDDERRLHGEAGPAVEYGDGYALSAWHGQRIPNEWVQGAPPSPAEALNWVNMDQRAAACEIVGWHNILDQLDAKVVEDSGDHVWGRLVEVSLPDSGRERFLDALCGTGRRFALPVPPKTKSVDEAQSVLHGGIPAHILRNCVERT